ncbi:Mitochondrial inner membrane protein OXA1L [Lamellibrachia satsuma]|nr:Mitochondrial inner membrane protein OXA1L [Lamellibrachia satsuma]
MRSSSAVLGNPGDDRSGMVKRLSTGCNLHKIRGIVRAHHILAQTSHHFKCSQAICGVLPVRFQSSDSAASTTTQATEIPEGYIPDVPPIPDVPISPEVTDVLNALGEPTLQSLGLGLTHWTPPGLVQTALEYMHVSMGVPWWAAIVAGTITLRLCVFPLVILAQRNAASMHNHMPTVQKLQERFTKSRMSGNPMDAARAGQELMDYMKRNNVNPLKNVLVPMAQLPIFISVFMGIRQMTTLPLQSMTTGGILWFTDLTICDPFYALPIMTMATFLLTLELGVDGIRADSMSHVMRYVMRAMPFVMLPFIMNFPTAMLCYWFTSNVFSLTQVLMLKIPGAKDYFNIPRLVKHDKSEMPKKKKFVEGFKETWHNSKVAAEMENRQRVEALRFKEAGMGPIQKTFPYDPTKSISKSKSAVSAKPKS